MEQAADDMEFEQAAQWRDRVLVLKEMDLGLKPPSRARVNSAAPEKTEERPGRFKKGAIKAAKARRRR